ncbi:RND family transporter [Vibrio sinensis]|uniref:RND family transporter n=1 Tax=Vibrio sinensis TaxID=2302434 RepID=A0A3A6R3J5_9VIBR|nr:MMPL family transporter [Vibrio sinensis]RJX71469.1 RND family transporter [Vibrio sinensis]
MSTHTPTQTQQFVDKIGRLIINWRFPLAIIFLCLTVLLSYTATKTRFDPGFTKLIPVKHQYMEAFLEHAEKFTGTNRIMVSLTWQGEGDIYNPELLSRLRKATDSVFFTPGVNRATVRSLFTPEIRYLEVTEFGFMGDVVIPSRFTADKAGLEQVRSNVAKSGQIGNLVSNDLKSAMVQAELLDIDPETGEKTNYAAVAKHLENIRTELAGAGVDIQIIGFAKVMGDVMDGLSNVLMFFSIAFVVTVLLLWHYTMSIKLTGLIVAVALLPVVWLLGTLPLIGYGIDPMSLLVPFLIFSIGVSHAVQMTNAWKLDVLSGIDSKESAINAFRRLAIPGTVALLANALGFMVIMVIDIPIVHELGVTACLGVAMMIMTNKMFMPIILSHLSLENMALRHKPTNEKHSSFWWSISALATEKPAKISVAIMLILLVAATWQSRNLLTGDIGNGVPELHADSRYNLDNEKIVNDYSIGMDVLSIYLETRNQEEACLNWEIMNAVDRFDFHMRGVDGVQSVATTAGTAKRYVSGNNEGNPLWRTLQRDPIALRAGAQAARPQLGLNDNGCQTINMMVYLNDHQSTTLNHVVSEIKSFIEKEQLTDAEFRLLGGNAGVAEATNQAVEKAEVQILISIFVAIGVLCWLTFRSFTATLCVILPLMLVCIMCNALMATLGIGLKVATLPVIALGVGVGVDYGIYIYERMQHDLNRNIPLREAFYQSIQTRGIPAIFTAVTMSVSVATWAFSSLKFQADMGVLLAFMFLVNVLGAMLLLPALAYLLGAKAVVLKSPKTQEACDVNKLSADDKA